MGVRVLRLSDVGHRAGGRVLFERLDLDMQAGETCVIQGASGAGKSTLARLIAGWLPPQSGRRIVDGDVALIPQHPFTACAAHMTVGRIVAEPLLLRGAAGRTSPDVMQAAMPDAIQDAVQHAMQDAIPAAVQAALRAVRLPDDAAFLSRRPAHLSGGELQRVTLARALMRMPDVLVADEPTSALDPANRQNILRLLARLQRRHRFALLVFTHDPLVAQVLRCRTLALDQGALRC